MPSENTAATQQPSSASTPVTAILARAATPPPGPRAHRSDEPGHRRPAEAAASHAAGPWQAIERLMTINDAQASRLATLERSSEAMQARLADQAGIIAQLSRDRIDAVAEAARAHARLDAAVPHMISGMLIDAGGDLVAIGADGSQRTVGRVRGRDADPGRDGCGIADAAIDVGGHLLLTLTDNRRLDLGAIRDTTPPPAAIADVMIDGDGDLVAVLSDATTRRIGRVRGTDGSNGATIAEAATNAVGHLVITMTDGRRIDAGLVREAAAQPPATSHLVGMALDDAGDLVEILADGSRRRIGRVRGTDGSNGATIAEAATNAVGHLVITMTDGRRIDAGRIVDPTPKPPAIAEMLVDGDGDLVAVLADASTRRIGRVKGDPGTNGATVADAVINDVGRLVVSMTDGRRIDAGAARVVERPDTPDTPPKARANRAKARAALADLSGITASASLPPWALAGVSRSTWYRRGNRRTAPA